MKERAAESEEDIRGVRKSREEDGVSQLTATPVQKVIPVSYRRSCLPRDWAALFTERRGARFFHRKVRTARLAIHGYRGRCKLEA